MVVYPPNNVMDDAFMMLPSQPRTEAPQLVQEESRYPTRNRRPPERLTYYDHVTPTAVTT